MGEIRIREANPFWLFMIRIGVVAVIAGLCSVTIFYCSNVYYDQNAALQDVFSCASNYLEKANTTFWLDGGTLLGAMRHRKFTVWEGDVTLGALSNATGGLYDAMLQLAEKCKLHLSPPPADWDNSTAIGWYLYNSQAGLMIREWIPTKEDVLAHGERLALSFDTFFPRKKCDLHSFTTTCPNNGSALLESQFGSDWLSAPLMQLFS